MRRTPFASLTPAPPTIYFVPLCGTRILRAPPPARVRGWTRLRNHYHPTTLEYTLLSWFSLIWLTLIDSVIQGNAISVYNRYSVTDQKCSDARKSSEILASREYIGVFDVVSRSDARKSGKKPASPHNRKGPEVAVYPYKYERR